MKCNTKDDRVKNFVWLVLLQLKDYLIFDVQIKFIKEKEASDYTDLEKIKIEVEQSKKIFKKNKWPTIDVTRKSVEETAASIIKIYEIKNKNA